MNKLLIVESPTKARTITRMLGRDFQVLASMGHIRDLPEHTFGVDIEHDFKPEYVDTPAAQKLCVNCGPPPKRPMKFIWPLTLTAKGKPLHGIWKKC